MYLLYPPKVRLNGLPGWPQQVAPTFLLVAATWMPGNGNHWSCLMMKVVMWAPLHAGNKLASCIPSSTPLLGTVMLARPSEYLPPKKACYWLHYFEKQLLVDAHLAKHGQTQVFLNKLYWNHREMVIFHMIFHGFSNIYQRFSMDFLIFASSVRHHLPGWAMCWWPQQPQLLGSPNSALRSSKSS